MRGIWRLSGVLMVLTCAAAHAAPPGGEAVSAAEALLRQALSVDRSGQHHRLLRSLRHLEDPQLRPLFERLAASNQPALRIHGMLGLAELSQERQLDLALLAGIDEPTARGELLTAAMDSDLLSEDQAEQVLAWKDLDPGSQLLVLSRRVAQDGLSEEDRVTIAEALESPKLGRRSVAALLLHQLGDQRGMQGLMALDQSNDPQRDAIRAMLLTTAIRHELRASRDWAHAIAVDPAANPRLALLGLRAALRFGDPRAAGRWQQQVRSTTDLAQQIRLGITGLQLAPYVPQGMFDVLLDHPDALLRQIGRAGNAIASGDANLANEVVALIEHQHPIVNEWALSYAEKLASPQDAMLILLAVIDAYERGQDDGRRRLRRLDHAAVAAQKLFEMDPQTGRNLLRPIIANPETDALLVQGLLLGLVRSREPGTDIVVTDMPPLAHPRSAALVLLIKAKNGAPLSEQEMKDLALLVRGGGELDDSLRIQAAWLLLKRLSQAESVLGRVLASMK